MTVPTLNYVSCPDATGTHRMAYWQWGDPAAPHLVVCAHGISRQGRDFDTLAAALVERSPRPLRVVCPDVVGRGRSDWLKDPAGYQIPMYAMDMLAMLAQLNGVAPVQTFDWVGTSMGGLIGLGVAGKPGLPLPAPVHRLVLNDVGPVIQYASLQRIGGYLGQTGRFDTVQQAADAMWLISQGFGPHTPAQWLQLSEAMVKPLAAGGFTLHYDPQIAIPFRLVTEQVARDGQAEAWALFDHLRCETLVLRGADSDVLAADTAREMAQRGPKPRIVEFAGVGHAPTLIAPDQVDAVASFLFAPDSPPHEESRGGTG